MLDLFQCRNVVGQDGVARSKLAQAGQHGFHLQSQALRRCFDVRCEVVFVDGLNGAIDRQVQRDLAFLALVSQFQFPHRLPEGIALQRHH
jgi:hypothetical protein